MLNRYLCHRADGLARCGTDGSDFDCPSSRRTCSTLKLPPEAGEALSFLGEVPMAPLGIEAALSANNILLENCPIHPTSAT